MIDLTFVQILNAEVRLEANLYFHAQQEILRWIQHRCLHLPHLPSGTGSLS